MIHTIKFTYYGVEVPSSLPTVDTHDYAILILYSALSIKLCRFAIGKPLPLAVKIIDLVRYINWNFGGNTIKAVESSKHAYSLVHKALQPQLLAEQERKQQEKKQDELRSIQLAKEHDLRVARQLAFEKEQALRIERAESASFWLHVENNDRNVIAKCICTPLELV